MLADDVMLGACGNVLPVERLRLVRSSFCFHDAVMAACSVTVQGRVGHRNSGDVVTVVMISDISSS